MSLITQPRRYLWMLLGITVIALLTIGAFNLLVDPFRVFGTPIRAGFNDHAPDTNGFDRMAKPYELLRATPRTVFLGSSTMRAGFRSIETWDIALPRPVFNYALLGANAHEVRLSLTQALRECPIETVVLAADFFAFNANYLDNERFDPARLSAATRSGWPGFLGSDFAAFFLGREALGLSWQTLVASRRTEGNASAIAPWWQDRPWHVHFCNCERSYMEKWYPPPAHSYEFASTQTGADCFADFDGCLRICAEHGVRLIVFCPPVHARFQEAIAAAGAWPNYEAWKRTLASRTRAQQAKPSGTGSVELWDFSLFNELSCEALPDDGAGPMRYFIDSAHFTPEFGRLVLDQILNPSLPTRLGVRLDQVEIESHLTGIRAALESFRVANPGAVADIHAALGIEESRSILPVASSVPRP